MSPHRPLSSPPKKLEVTQTNLDDSFSLFSLQSNSQGLRHSQSQMPFTFGHIFPFSLIRIKQCDSFHGDTLFLFNSHQHKHLSLLMFEYRSVLVISVFMDLIQSIRRAHTYSQTYRQIRVSNGAKHAEPGPKAWARSGLGATVLQFVLYPIFRFFFFFLTCQSVCEQVSACGFQAAADEICQHHFCHQNQNKKDMYQYFC